MTDYYFVASVVAASCNVICLAAYLRFRSGLGYAVICAMVTLFLVVWSRPANAADTMADVALVLAVDVSASIDDTERQLQREGYASAITSPEVLKAITDGAHGRIVVTVFEWSDAYNQDLRVPWMVIETPADAQVVATLIRKPGSTISHSTTSVAGALGYAARLLDRAPVEAERHVVDVSGDGKDFATAAVKVARSALLARGVTINGLPIVGPGTDDPDVERYYADEIIGGPGAFVVPARGFADLPGAVRRKLALEIG